MISFSRIHFRMGPRVAAVVALVLLALTATRISAASPPPEFTRPARLNLGTLSARWLFVATTPDGNLVAAAMNPAQAAAPNSARPVPLVLIRNPLAEAPVVHEICRIEFPGQRGFSGLAVDSEGAIYVSGDTGRRETSFLRKFTPSGADDITFGSAGELRPGARCLGLDIAGDVLLLAVDWGRIRAFDAHTGRFLTETPAPLTTGPLVYVRDIAWDPSRERIWGIAGAGVVVWDSVRPAALDSAQFRTLRPSSASARSDEAIGWDPLLRRAVLFPPTGLVPEWIDDHGQAQPAAFTATASQDHAVDVAFTRTGDTVFFTVPARSAIWAARRDIETPVPDSESIAMAAAAKPAGAGAAARSTPGAWAAHPPNALVSSPFLVPARAGAASSPDRASGGSDHGSGIATTPTSPFSLGSVSTPAQKLDWLTSIAEARRQSRAGARPLLVYFRAPGPACEEFEKGTLLTAKFAAAAEGFVLAFADARSERDAANEFGVARVPCVVLLRPDGTLVHRYTNPIDSVLMLAGLQDARAAR